MFFFILLWSCEKIIHQNLNYLLSTTNGEILYHAVQVNGVKKCFQLNLNFSLFLEQKYSLASEFLEYNA